MPRLIDVDALFDATIAVLAERGYDGATTARSPTVPG